MAVVGLGVRGRHWVDAIQKSTTTEVSAVIDPRTRVIDAPAPLFTDLRHALEHQKFDGVVIATPPDSHYDLVESCLTSGIPTLCEKPLSEEYDEAEAMSDLSRQTGVPLLVGMNFRFIPAVTDKRALVTAGSFGAPMFGSFTYIRNRDGRRPDLNDYPLTMSDPMLREQTIHHVDLFRYVYGREARSVQATMWNPTMSVYQDSSCVAALVRFDDDLVVNYIGTWTSGSSDLDFRWRTDFETGCVIQPGQFQGLMACELDQAMLTSGPLYGRDEPLWEKIGRGDSTPFAEDTYALLQHFVDVIHGDASPGPTAEDHLLTLRLLDAIGESARSGSSVQLFS